jgi:hypothetical protein
VSFLGISEIESQNLANRFSAEPPDPQAFAPRMVEATDPAEIYKGARRGIAKGALLLNDSVLTAGAKALDEVFDTTTFSQYTRDEHARLVDKLRLFSPDPYTTGVVGQILNSVVDIGGTALVGTAIGGPPGGAALAGSLTGYSSMVEGKDQGLDEVTALGKGVIEGATVAAGVRIPAAFGTSLLRNTLVYGPGANVAIGMASRAGVSEWLRANGYEEQAEQSQVFDTMALITDGVLGSVFGYLGAKANIPLRRSPLPSDVDAALASNQGIHREVDVAPGIPTDWAARTAHREAMSEAIDGLLTGRPVELESLTREAKFLEKPQAGERRAVAESALREAGYGHALDETATPEPLAPVRGRVVPEGTPPETAPVERPPLTIVDEEGRTLSAQQAIAQADADVVAATTLGKGLRAAVACFMRVGA